jgi:hypothetical protein
MSRQNLGTYLNDHLAGSTVALELLDHLKDSEIPGGLRSFLTKIQADISKDRAQLEALMSRLDIKESRPRRALAWLSEKATRLKLHLDDRSGGAFRLFESLELVALGIDGKSALWRALATAAKTNAELRGPDYDRLERRALDQRARMEKQRLHAGRAALGPD